MLSDSTILKHIARQPKRSAGFKQLVRELGLHGSVAANSTSICKSSWRAGNWCR